MRLTTLGKLVALILVCTFTLGADSCSSTPGANPTFVADLVLKNAAGAVRQEFAPGEPITMELTVRNRASTEAILQFNKDGNRLSVTVEDNGRGFNTEAGDAQNGIGLESVKSRVTYLNGQLSIDSQQEVGTTVMMDFLIND